MTAPLPTMLTREEKIILNGKFQIRNLPEQEDNINEYVDEIILKRYVAIVERLKLIKNYTECDWRDDTQDGYNLLIELIAELETK
jgi:hypothetical protein